jgi:hypothetical protein
MPVIDSNGVSARGDHHGFFVLLASVIKGTWYAGTGPVFDPAKATPLPAGSYMLHPAKEVHWDGAAGDEEVIVQVVGIGPSGTTTVDPKGPLFGEATK